MNLIQKLAFRAAKRLSGFAQKASLGHIQNVFHGFGNIFQGYAAKEAIKSGYGMNDTLYSIVTKAARTIANTIKWRVMEVDLATGEMVEVFDTELNEIINRPNTYQTQTEWREQIVTYLMLTGRSFVGGLRSIGFGDKYSSLHNLPSDRTDFKLGNLTKPYEHFKVDWGMQKVWDGNDVLFTKYVNMVMNDDKSVFDGQSPILAGHRLLESSNHLIEADASVLKNRGVAGILSNRTGDVLMPDDKKKLDDALQNELGGSHKFNKITSTSANVDFIPLGLSPGDLKLLESDVSKTRRFSNLFGLDSSLFNDPANKTFNNRKEAAKDAYSGVYIPTDEKIVQGLNRWLAPLFKPSEGKKLVIMQDVSEIEALQEDKDKSSMRDERRSREVFKILTSIGKPLENGGMTKEAARVMLLDIHGFDEDEANNMLNGIAN